MTTAHSGSGDPRRSMELLWRDTADRPARGPRPALCLRRIVAAAVELADREGLEALSMRRVAAELGVGTMSLYRYLPGKGELLDLMLDQVVGPPEAPPPPESAAGDARTGPRWRHDMAALARSMWRLYLAHPWLIHVNQSRPVLGPNSLAGFEHALASLDGLGLSGKEKVKIIMAIEHYVTGTARTFIQQRQVAEQSGVSDDEFWASQGPILAEVLAGGKFPEVAKLPADSFAIDGEEALEFGLGPLLDGLAVVVAHRARHPAPPADRADQDCCRPG
ncbi:TetR/AcrR family transcriptional regulator [Streptomyces aidingensis]|uniref:Regulatory protein, tetR family n=1 Tax=Streptomyces aidingensis TaxID=910347 RepID=A0A1I1HM40_9ACTN|nr:TetR/AcrR family transcriptional regulator [Streptomyces aidingensis]SFC22120.1 regulatory protein, tetR family [Streptomyces aidingensis]